MVIAALDCLVMVFNALLAPQLLANEVLTWHDFLASLVTVLGVMLVVFAGPKNADEYDGDQLISLMKNPAFIVFASLCVTACASMQGALNWAQKALGKHRTNDDTKPTGAACAVAAGTVPAILSSFNLQLSKCTGELIHTSLGGDNQFSDWPVYVFIVLLVICNTMQVVSLQHALRNYDALLIVPIFQVQLTVFAIVNGGIFFDEFSQWTDATEPALFFTGLATCLFGVLLLSRRKFLARQAGHSPGPSPKKLDSLSVCTNSPAAAGGGGGGGAAPLTPGSRSWKSRSFSFKNPNLGILLEPSVSGGVALLAADNQALTSMDDDFVNLDDTVGTPRSMNPLYQLEDKDWSDSK
eukprot:gene5876-9004_t